MSRYEIYKKVNLSWLNEVPEGWSFISLKRIGELKTGNSIRDDEKNKFSNNNGARIFVTTSDINSEKMEIIHKSNIYIPFENKSFKLCIPGSTLVCIEGGSGGKKVAITNEEVNFGNKLCSIKSHTQHDKYIYYIICSRIFKKYYQMFINGDRNGVSLANIKNFIMPVPSLIEQKQIVDYLDWKINEIDKLISIEKDKLNKIRLLKEQHIEDIIFNDGSETSISNWYNYLPKMATEIKIKNIFRLRDERNYLPEEEVELLSLYTRLGVIKNKDIDKRTGNKNTTVYNYKKVYQQDIVVNIMLCWMGAIGISDYNGVTSPAYDVYKPDLKRVNPKYYHYLFRTNKFKSELYKNGKGIVLMKWRVYADKFKNIIVPLPSLDEQRRIVELIENVEFNIREYIRSINNTIKDLGLLKESLISEVVTGQIDVRNVVIPAYEKVDSIIDEEVEGEELLEDGD